MRVAARVVRTVALCVLAASLAAVTGGCTHQKTETGSRLKRQGDEIIVAGQFFHTGAPVVTWLDPGGYNAYHVEPRFPATTQAAKPGEDSPSDAGPYYSARKRVLSPEEQELTRSGWPLSLAQQKIDQFVYHYSVDPCSAAPVYTLHDRRGLSVHFMLDVDGTIYQTLDVTERAWHATKANDRSVGIEIANLGAYPPNDSHHTLEHWFQRDAKGPYMVVPERWAKYIRTPNFLPRPARSEPVVGQVQGRTYEMYDLTPQQYDSLIKLTATLCTALPKIKCDYPRDEHGDLITHALTQEQWENYQGLLGHYHIQTNKQDPGPAFQWDKVINGARKLMGLKPLPKGDTINNPKQAVAQAK
jgi:N-acetyl-anhydromuramyl-L-alanine amidase AmpD